VDLPCYIVKDDGTVVRAEDWVNDPATHEAVLARVAANLGKGDAVRVPPNVFGTHGCRF
jgi:hypothetical protein